MPIQKPTKCVCWLLLHRLPQRVTSGERRRVRKMQDALQTRRREAQTALLKDRLDISVSLLVNILKFCIINGFKKEAAPYLQVDGAVMLVSH